MSYGLHLWFAYHLGLPKIYPFIRLVGSQFNCPGYEHTADEDTTQIFGHYLEFVFVRRQIFSVLEFRDRCDPAVIASFDRFACEQGAAATRIVLSICTGVLDYGMAMR